MMPNLITDYFSFEIEQFRGVSRSVCSVVRFLPVLELTGSRQSDISSAVARSVGVAQQ